MRARPLRLSNSPVATLVPIAFAMAGANGCATPFPDRPLVRAEPPVTPFVLGSAPRDRPLATASVAPELGDITVEQAVLLALRNDPELQVRSLTPVVAGTFEALERGVFDPELFTEAAYFRERASQTARATGERFDVTGETTDETIGVRQQLPTGTALELILRHRLDDSDRTPAQNEARLGLTVTQSLLRGFGPAVNLAALRQSELGIEASRFELSAFAAEVVQAVEVAYWTLALAEAEVQVFEEALRVARREAEEVGAQIEVGRLPEIDRAAAEAELALREQDLLDARARRRDARLRLLARVSPTPFRGAASEVRPASPLAAEPRSLDDVELRVAIATERRPELGQARVELEQGRLQTVVTRNGLLPQLDVFVALGKTGFDQSFLDAFRRLDGPTFDVRAGLSLGYALGHRAARAEDLRARVSIRQARLAVANLERMVRLEVRLAANELERARAQIEATRVTRKAREAAVAAERARLEVGAGTALLLARAERDLVESRVDELRAAVDYRVARVRLYLAEGTLLARRGIVVDAPFASI